MIFYILDLDENSWKTMKEPFDLSLIFAIDEKQDQSKYHFHFSV